MTNSLIIIGHKNSYFTGSKQLANSLYDKFYYHEINDIDLTNPIKTLIDISKLHPETDKVFIDLFGLYLNTNLEMFFKSIKRAKLKSVNLLHPLIKYNQENISQNSNIIIQNCYIDESLEITGPSCISQFCSIYQNCKLGKFTSIGPNSILKNNVSLLDHTLIGENILLEDFIKVGEFSEVNSFGKVLKSSLPRGTIISQNNFNFNLLI